MGWDWHWDRIVPLSRAKAGILLSTRFCIPFEKIWRRYSKEEKKETRSGFRAADELFIHHHSFPLLHVPAQFPHIPLHLSKQSSSQCKISELVPLEEHPSNRTSTIAVLGFLESNLLHALRTKFSWWRLCCTTTISHESQCARRLESITAVTGLPVARQGWGLSGCFFPPFYWKEK